MIKKISVNQLKPGMYVHDLNTGWLGHPFLTNSVSIKDESSIRKIINSGIRELYIDTTLGLDVSDAPTQQEVDEKLHQELHEVATRTLHQNSVAVNVELVRAEHIHRQAKDVVGHVFNDIKMGQQIHVDQVDTIVDQMLDSIMRNKDALGCLGMIRQKDAYLFEHSVNLGVLMVVFGKWLGFDRELLHPIGVGALLHDIGKIRVDNQLLNKKSRLDFDEYEQMKQHVVYTREILDATPGINPLSIEVAGLHHERIDGSGYPHGLKGNEISQFGHMIAIIDVYDALTADRVYHKAMPPTSALKRLLEWSRHHFEPGLVEQFIKCMGIYPVGSMVQLNTGQLGIVVEPGETDSLHPTIRIVFDTRQGHFLAPRDINLAALAARGVDEYIIGWINPSDYKINIRDFI